MADGWHDVTGSGGDPWELLAPGPELARVLASVDSSTLPTDARVSYLAATDRLIGWAHVLQAHALVAVADAVAEATSPGPGMSSSYQQSCIADEVAAALHVATRTASYRVNAAAAIVRDWPLLGIQVAAGVLTVAQAREIAQGAAVLSGILDEEGQDLSDRAVAGAVRIAADLPPARLRERVARIVRAAGLKRTLMEASGNGPVIVCSDADLSAAAEAAVFGAYWNAGQVCCATQRVLVDRRVAPDFADAVIEASAAAVLGDPFDDATTMGPLANSPTATKMDEHIADAVERGARVRLGGGRASGYPTDLYYEFTVVDGVDSSMRIAREESFGPVVPIVACDDDEGMLATANSDPLGLQAAVFTKSLSRAFAFSEGLRCGSVVVNDSTDYFESAQPFGGASGTRTGWGRVGGLQQLRDMTDVRCTIISLDEE